MKKVYLSLSIILLAFIFWQQQEKKVKREPSNNPEVVPLRTSPIHQKKFEKPKREPSSLNNQGQKSEVVLTKKQQQAHNKIQEYYKSKSNFAVELKDLKEKEIFYKGKKRNAWVASVRLTNQEGDTSGFKAAYNDQGVLLNSWNHDQREVRHHRIQAIPAQALKKR